MIVLTALGRKEKALQTRMWSDRSARPNRTRLIPERQSWEPSPGVKN
jgi:hypothetical protein